MGGNSSKSSVQQVNEFFNQTTNSFMSSVSQNVSASASSRQTANFNDATFKGCRVKLSQGTSITVGASGELKSENLQDLTTQLANSSNAAIDNAATQSSGFLAPSIMNSADARTNLKNQVTNIITNTMSSQTVQDIIATSINNQDINASRMYAECNPEYRLPGEYDFEFDQNVLQSVTAKGIADALTKALTDTIVENTTSTGVSQSATQQTRGLDDLVSAVFKGMTGIWGIIAIVVIVLILGAVAFLLRPGGQQASVTLADAGAKRMGGP